MKALSCVLILLCVNFIPALCIASTVYLATHGGDSCNGWLIVALLVIAVLTFQWMEGKAE